MINTQLLKHLFVSQETHDIDFYNEVAEILHTDITELILILQNSENIFNIVQNVDKLSKLLHLIVSENNACLCACIRIQRIYESDVFDHRQFMQNMQIVRAFDVNEHLYIQ